MARSNPGGGKARPTGARIDHRGTGRKANGDLRGTKPAPKPKSWFVAPPTRSTRVSKPLFKPARRVSFGGSGVRRPLFAPKFVKPIMAQYVRQENVAKQRSLIKALTAKPTAIPKYVRAPKVAPADQVVVPVHSDRKGRVTASRVVARPRLNVPHMVDALSAAAKQEARKNDRVVAKRRDRIISHDVKAVVENRKNPQTVNKSVQRLRDYGVLPGKSRSKFARLLAAEKDRQRRTVAERKRTRDYQTRGPGGAYSDVMKWAHKQTSDPANQGIVGSVMGAIAGGPTVVSTSKSKGSRRLAVARPLVQTDAKAAKLAGKVGLNVVKDAVDLPAQTVSSVYFVGKSAGEGGVAAAKGDWKKAGKKEGEAAKALYQPYVDLAKHPGKSFVEHPLATGLMLSGLKGGVGRGVGKALRVAPSKSLRRAGSITGRAPAVSEVKTNLVAKRYYSKDSFTKAAQVVSDRRKYGKGKGPVLSVEDIQRRVDSTVGRNEGIRRVNRTKIVKAVRKAVGKKPTAATRLAAERIIVEHKASGKSLVDELTTYRAEVANQKPGNPAQEATRKQLLGQIDSAIKNFDEAKVKAGSQAYVDLSVGLQNQLADLGLLDKAQGDRARLMSYAVRYMGAKHDGEALLRQGETRRPLKTINKDITQATRSVRQAQSLVKRTQLSALRTPPRLTAGLRAAEKGVRKAEFTYRKRRAEDRNQRGNTARKRSKALSQERQGYLAHLRSTDPMYLKLEQERKAVNAERRGLRERVQNREVLSKPERKHFKDLSSRSRDLTGAIKKIESESTAPVSVLRNRRSAIGSMSPERKSLKRRNEAQFALKRARQKVEREKKAARKLVSTDAPKGAKVKIVDSYGREVSRTHRKAWGDRTVVNDYGTVVRTVRKPRSAADRLIDAVAHERAAVRRSDALKAERASHGDAVLTTAEIKAKMEKDAGVGDAAFLTQAPGAGGAKAYFVSQSQGPKIGGHARTGEAVRKGFFDANPVTLEENAAAAQGLIDGAKGWKNHIQDASLRDASNEIIQYKSYKDSINEARQIEASTGVKLVPVRAQPFGGKQAALDELVKSSDQTTNLADAMVEATSYSGGKVPKNDAGPWVLQPQAYVARMNEHMKMIGRGGVDPIGQGIGNVFRPLVLATSPKWLVGNIVEAALRSGVNHAGPRSWYTMHRIMKKLEKSNPDLHAVLMEEVLGGGHFAMSSRVAVHVSKDRFIPGSKMNEFSASVGAFARAPGVKMLPQLWHAYTNFVMNTVNRSIERQFQTAMAGKRIRETLMDDDLLKLSDKAFDSAAKGLTDINEVIALGQAVDRAYGRYSKFSPRQRFWISMYTPFIAWSLNAVRFCYDVLPRDHPVLTALLASAYVSSEDWRKSQGLSFSAKNAVPGFLQGSIPGEGGSHLRASRYTPFGAFAETGGPIGTFGNAFIPQFSSLIANSEGKDWTGKKLPDQTPPGIAQAMGVTFLGQFVPFFGPVKDVDTSKEKTLGMALRRRFDPTYFTQGKPSGSSGGSSSGSGTGSGSGYGGYGGSGSGGGYGGYGK